MKTIRSQYCGHEEGQLSIFASRSKPKLDQTREVEARRIATAKTHPIVAEFSG